MLLGLFLPKLTHYTLTILLTKKHIKVAVLTTSYPLRKDSVSGIFVKRLVENLPSWVEAEVITPCSTKELELDISNNNQIQCFKYAPRSWQILAHESGGIPVALQHRKFLILLLPVFMASMFIACLKVSKSCDVIHANWSINGLIAGLAGMITRTPVVTTLRGEDIAKSDKSKLYGIILKLCIVMNRKIISVSEAINNQLTESFPNHVNKLMFLPNGVDSNFLEAVNSREPAGDKDEEVLEILTVSSLIPRKGVKDIINALSKIKKTESNFRLSIVGAGVEKNHLEQLVDSFGLTKHVNFLGNVSPQEMPNYFMRADVFILASYSEGRPNVILESFAAGVPVIASEIDGITELVEENITGLLFFPGDSIQLATKIKLLKKNKQLRDSLAKKGKELILNNELLWPKIGIRYASIYESVM
jgi:glycosyltransferase involved in cell wall biosynthesis